ncbi:hypothetical protein PHLCEN_2v3025 [Hermanssonia centrifuga]|uniref:Uncharacterized protein n=1 Tax=Hermanssonia centrifuga TaxID=98765 RepID=A0A2R6R7C9_9APHY|nr:hypothetical protein PHLCEN_2v3025 [Hermanssonia centrifuga]
MSKEKEWAANIGEFFVCCVRRKLYLLTSQCPTGMMDWDNTRIVFTKRTLIEFLKYTGTTVDTNLSNIAKLPSEAPLLVPLVLPPLF